MISIFLQSLIVGYSGALMPGTLFTYTIEKSLKKGPYSGLLISIGHSLLELFTVLILLFGAGEIITTDIARIIIGVVGGCFLIYFGIDMLKDVIKKKVSINQKNNNNKVYDNRILGGIIISVTNPYFTFWWAVIGLSLITKAFVTLGYLGVVIFYIGHILSDITWFSFVSIVVHKSKKIMNDKIYSIILLVLGISVIGFGVSFIIDSIKLLVF